MSPTGECIVLAETLMFVCVICSIFRLISSLKYNYLLRRGSGCWCDVRWTYGVIINDYLYSLLGGIVRTYHYCKSKFNTEKS